MSGKFTHYLVTRFNILIEGYGPEFIAAGIRTSQWEMERLPLFESFCAPSVAGQRSQNFTWMIYCDSQTPSPVLNRIKVAVKKVSSCEIILVGGFKEMISHLQHWCAQSNTPFVITSRLDNDDAIGIDYIKDIQSHFIPSGNVIVNLLGGVNYHASKGILTYHRYSLNNSFLSLIEETQSAPDMITVMGFRHLAPKANMIVRNFSSRFSFWMTLHPLNAASRINLGWPAIPSSILRQYTIDHKVIHISIINTISYTIKWLPGAVYGKLKFIFRKAFQTSNDKSGSGIV